MVLSHAILHNKMEHCGFRVSSEPFYYCLIFPLWFNLNLRIMLGVSILLYEFYFYCHAMYQLMSTFEERRYFLSEKVLSLFEYLNHNFIKESCVNFTLLHFTAFLREKKQ